MIRDVIRDAIAMVAGRYGNDVNFEISTDMLQRGFRHDPAAAFFYSTEGRGPSVPPDSG
jgi:hypothetical protein